MYISLGRIAPLPHTCTRALPKSGSLVRPLRARAMRQRTGRSRYCSRSRSRSIGSGCGRIPKRSPRRSSDRRRARRRPHTYHTRGQSFKHVVLQLLFKFWKFPPVAPIRFFPYASVAVYPPQTGAAAAATRKTAPLPIPPQSAALGVVTEAAAPCSPTEATRTYSSSASARR